MRVFVNNVDGYLAGAICADLARLTHNITGTRKLRDDSLVPPMVKRIVPRIEVRKLLKAVAACDVVVYDLHDADLEELELLLRVFHASDFSQDLTFILVSSVGVWARTQRELEEIPEPVEVEPPKPSEGAEEGAEEAPAEGEGAEGEAVVAEPLPPPKPRPKPLRSEDYTRRVPAPKFQEWRHIETQVLGLREKSTVRPYVVCAGVPYGNGEDCFVSLFRAAWQSKTTLRTIGDGLNYIPLVHVRDCARLIRHVVEEKPDLAYHIAVDKGDLTQRHIVESVAKEFAISYPIQSVSVLEALLAELADILTMDLRVEPCPIMQRSPPPKPPEPEPPAEGVEGEEAAEGDAVEAAPPPPLEVPAVAVEEPEEAGPPPFRWWCEQGLAANAATVAKEFVRWRRLDPVRLCVTGPPGCGSEALGARLAERYNVPLIVLDKVLEEMKNEETELGQELKAKMEEVAASLAAGPKGKGPDFLDAGLLNRVAEAAVAGPLQRMRGYVLAGYPQTQEEADLLLLEDPPPPPPEEEQEEAEEEEAEGEEAAEEAAEEGPPGKVPRAGYVLDGVVLLESSVEECTTRLQEGGTFNPTEFTKKMERWKQETGAGGEEDPNPFALLFSEKLGLAPVAVNADEVQDFEDTVNQVAAQVEAKRGPIRNFVPPAKPKVEVVEEVVDEGVKEDPEALRREAEAARKRKEAEEKLEAIKKEEFVRLEKHSEPLRNYLMSLVVPTLTSGLVETCKQSPEDPVGYLAEYLSVYSQVAKQHGKKLGAFALRSPSKGGVVRLATGATEN